MSARRSASARSKAWLASTMMRKSSPTASRTARSRALSSAIDGLPILTFAPVKPAFFIATASDTRLSAGNCSHPPSVV